MDEYTLTLNIAQLEATSIALRTHRDHINQVLDGIHQLVAPVTPPLPEAEAPPVEEITNG